MKVKKADNRKRSFATLCYLDSMPTNLFDIISDLHVPCFVSPLHDKDVNPDGELKKPHYHIFFMFDGKKSDNQWQEIKELIKGVGEENVLSNRGYARYLCHLDNPEKYQYPVDLVRSFGGADYSTLCLLNSDKYLYIGEIVDFCRVNRVYSYARLLDYCRLNNFSWFRCLCDSGTYVIKEYLKSLKWDNDNNHSDNLPADLSAMKGFLDSDVSNLPDL